MSKQEQVELRLEELRGVAKQFGYEHMFTDLVDSWLKASGTSSAVAARAEEGLGGSSDHSLAASLEKLSNNIEMLVNRANLCGSSANSCGSLANSRGPLANMRGSTGFGLTC